MKNIFAYVAFLITISSNAFVGTTDKWAGTWRTLDPIFGDMTFTLTEKGDGLFHLSTLQNGKFLDYGTASVTENLDLIEECGQLIERSLAFQVPGNSEADFTLTKDYCPDGTLFGEGNHLRWTYDTNISTGSSMWRDVTMVATLKFVE